MCKICDMLGQKVLDNGKIVKLPGGPKNISSEEIAAAIIEGSKRPGGSGGVQVVSSKRAKKGRN